jgi:hypothetical protein
LDEPFVTSLDFLVTVLEVSVGSYSKRGVFLNDSEVGWFLGEFFSRVKWERLRIFVIEPVLTLSKVEFNLSKLVLNQGSVCIGDNWVGNSAVLSWTEDDHLLWTGAGLNLLMVELDVGLRTNFDSGNVLVLIQDVDVLVRQDANG